MSFQFPDPADTQRVTNPATGEVWVYESGVWMLEELDPTPIPIPEPTPVPTEDCSTSVDTPTYNININTGSTNPAPCPTPTTTHSHTALEAEITLLKQKVDTLQNDILEVKAELQSVSTDHFLILE